MSEKYKVGDLVWYERYSGMSPPFWTGPTITGELAVIYNIEEYDVQPTVTVTMYEIITPTGERVWRRGDDIWRT